MELLEATEKDNLLNVKVKIKASWLSKLLGGKDEIDEITFNKSTARGIVKNGDSKMTSTSFVTRAEDLACCKRSRYCV